MNLHTRTMIPRQSSKLRASCCSREAINLFELVLSTVYKTRLERYIPPPIVRSDTLARGSMCSAPPVNRRGGALCVGWLQGAARCLLYKSWPGPRELQEKTEGTEARWGEEAIDIVPEIGLWFIVISILVWSLLLNTILRRHSQRCFWIDEKIHHWGTNGGIL